MADSYWWPVADGMFVQSWPTKEELKLLRYWLAARELAQKAAPDLLPYLERLRPKPKDLAEFKLHLGYHYQPPKFVEVK